MTSIRRRDDRPDGPPTIAEVAALTRRLRELSARGSDADPAERAAFLADKEALLARIAEVAESTDHERTADVDDAERPGVVHPGYVGPCNVPISRDGELAGRVARLHGQAMAAETAAVIRRPDELSDDTTFGDEDATGWSR